MLENIKHSIVLLQIAKNTAHPINGIYQGPGPIKLDSQDTLGMAQCLLSYCLLVII